MLLLVSVAVPLQAATYDIRIKVDKNSDKEKEKIKNDGRIGSGKKDIVERQFDAELRNVGFDTVENVSLKFYVLGERHDWKGDESPIFVADLLESKDMTLERNRPVEVDLGMVVFASTNTRQGNMFWRGGSKYIGWVAEIFVGDKLVTTESDKSSSMRAFKKLQNAGALKPKK